MSARKPETKRARRSVAAWHRAHRMPRNPTPEQRLKWHLAHAEACGCRPIPESVRELLRARKET